MMSLVSFLTLVIFVFSFFLCHSYLRFVHFINLLKDPVFCFSDFSLFFFFQFH